MKLRRTNDYYYVVEAVQPEKGCAMLAAVKNRQVQPISRRLQRKTGDRVVCRHTERALPKGKAYDAFKPSHFLALKLH